MQTIMKKIVLVIFAISCSECLFSQTVNQPPALAAIREADLRKDLYALADARFKGRSAGTLDELKASMWMAEQFRSIGLQPAGDDGTYFQFFSMWRNRLADHSSIRINNRPLTLWTEVAVSQITNKQLDAPIVYLGNARNLDLATVDVKGKVVALEAVPDGINMNISLPTWRYNRSVMVKYGNALVNRGAAAIIFIADETAENSWNDAVENFKRGSYDIEGGPNTQVTATVPVLWVHATAKQEL
eukprot:Opistho-1_new@30990